MVFINETHVMRSSGKVKTKRHLFSCFILAGSECCPMCQLLQTRKISTLRTCVWYWLHPSSGIILIDGVIHKTHVMPYSGKVKIKVICSHTLLLQVVSAAQCVSCSKQEHITTLRTCVWYWLHSSSGIDGVYS